MKWAKFGGRYIETHRGLKEEDWIFNDGANLQRFLSMSEFGKETCGMMYKARRTPLARKLYEVWGIDSNFVLERLLSVERGKR